LEGLKDLVFLLEDQKGGLPVGHLEGLKDLVFLLEDQRGGH
jgi:hypothetical protein